jgi:hypothetical protein
MRQRQARNVMQGGFERIRERSNGELTNDVAADGEVVWSWRPDAGVKFTDGKSALPGADEPHIPQATVANKPGHRGEHEGNR